MYYIERLKVLKKKGFKPDVIYDIGAYRGEWTKEIKQLFPKAQNFLFEANEYHRKRLEKLGYPFFIYLLGNRSELVKFYSNNSTGDSIFCEQTTFYSDDKYKIKEIEMKTLESIVNQNNLPMPNLIKIDAQGAEKMILDGSPSIISHAEAVILELKVLEFNKGAPLLYEVMTSMDQLGYQMTDILEHHFIHTKKLNIDELNEVDFLFIKKGSSLIKKGQMI